MNAMTLGRAIRAGLVGLLLPLYAYTPCFGYGAPGHSFIGALAEARLAKISPESLQKAKAMLEGMSLEMAATIPDQIRTWDTLPAAEKNLEKATSITSFPGKAVGVTWPAPLRQAVWEYFKKNSDFVDGQPRHHVYHFADIAIANGAPLAYNYDGNVVGESDTDIVHTLVHCFNVLHDGTPDVERGITPPIALILICHFVGDLHQPLHVGAEYFSKGTANAINPNGMTESQYTADRGGNSIAIPEGSKIPNDRHPERTIPGARADNLHTFWDKDAVDVAFDKIKVPAGPARTGFIANLAATDPKPSEHMIPAPNAQPKDYFSNWATEILPIAKEAHERLSFEIGSEKTKSGSIRKVIEVSDSPQNDSYLDWAGETTVHELLTGGFRLAWVLKQALEPN